MSRYRQRRRSGRRRVPPALGWLLLAVRVAVTAILLLLVIQQGHPLT